MILPIWANIKAMPDSAYNIRALHALFQRHGFHFSKSKGQNFLTDPDIPRAIAEASGADISCGVLEIGPGAGILTAALARRAGKVASVELDKTLLPVLSETLSDFSNIAVIQGDILKLDPAALAAEYFPGLNPIVCANLPYNITTPVLEKLIAASCFSRVTVMVQREVAQRLTAPDGSADSGAFARYLRYYMEPEFLFDVPREKFYPVPNVDSAVIQCVRRTQPAVKTDDEAFFFRVVRGGFLLRRKTLANSLSAALQEYSKEEILNAVKACGLPENIRGERLTLEQFAALAAALRSV